MQELVIGGIYRHFKGHIYKVLCTGRDASTLEEVVVYQNVEKEEDVWVRGKDEFLSLVDKGKYPEIKQKYRFERITE